MDLYRFHYHPVVTLAVSSVYTRAGVSGGAVHVCGGQRGKAERVVARAGELVRQLGSRLWGRLGGWVAGLLHIDCAESLEEKRF